MFWLLASFIFSATGLLYDVSNVSAKHHHGIRIPSEGHSWSFGQTMPVILLAVPFVTIVENLYPDEAPVRVLQTEARRDVLSSPPLLPWLEERHNKDNNPLTFNPDRDYYHASSSMKAGTVFIFVVEAYFGSYATMTATGSSPFEVFMNIPTQLVVFPVILITLWCIILFSLGIDWVVVSQEAGRGYVPKWLLLILLQFVNVAFSMAPVVFFFGQTAAYHRQD